ncbi:MAG: porin [Burkholderiales bacterium]|nr:MAG: porin [Burkholderiales bacterium]
MMKKSLVALAALAVVGVASAQSSVTLYGVLDVGFGKVKGGKFGLNNGEGYQVPSAVGAANQSQIRDGFNSTSVIGFRGSEDLGGGLKANFNLQSGGLDLASGATPVNFSREAWVGLSGGFGDFQLGRSSSVAAKTMGQFDLNGTSYSSALDRAGVSAVTWYGSSRRSDQLQYATPNFGGFQARLGLTLKGDATANGIGVPAAAKDRVTIGLGYANGPLAVAGVVETKATSALRDAYAFGASFDFGVAKVSAAYNRRELVGVAGSNSMTSGAGTGGKGASVGVVAPIGAFYVGAQYGRNSETNAKATELFAGYNLSKRTKIYADYVRVSGTAAVAAVAPTAAANGLSAIPTNPTAFGVGVVHSF